MKKNIILCVTLLALGTLQAEPARQAAISQKSKTNNDSLFQKSPATIAVQNRVLAKANSKLITVVDVMKRMDLVFFREYAHLADSLEARCQFYQQNWRSFLDDLIDSELIMADAGEKKYSVSEGDVREEMESLFGPNVVYNIDSYGLTFDEAKNMLTSDLTVRRMTYAMVNNRVMHQIHPKEVREIYEKEVKNNPTDDVWTYRVLSLNGPKSDECKQAAEVAYQLLSDNSITIDSINEALKEKNVLTNDMTVSVSDEFVRHEKELSTNHKDSLKSLNSGQYSNPASQLNRNTNQTVWRIFYVKDHQEGRIIPFPEVEDRIKQYLMEKAVAAETERYRTHLRERYNIDKDYLNEMIPGDFQPFHLN
ncbi:MAG: peptidyl-prolyl cis-trans isomerase [Parachlamydiales bacterium]|nr:peptidyl-prolyl cis-trans isomerase [Parachlamydiales bacterium]